MEILAKYQGNNAILRISEDILGDDRIHLNEKIQELVDNGVEDVVLNFKDAGLMDSVELDMLVAPENSTKLHPSSVSAFECWPIHRTSAANHQT